jgi:16S rRNA (cytosine1402-N4)-methyltransferase
MRSKHIPVLLSEVIEIMALKPGMTVVDATLGGGGYGRAIVDGIAPEGTYIGIDRDAQAIETAKKSQWVSLATEKGVRVILVHRNFSELQEFLRESELEGIDRVVADLGVSSDQLEDAQRGLSFLTDGPLDMRLDQSQGITAREIVNTWSGKEIERVLRENAEEKNARRIAQAIEKQRTKRPIETTRELAEIVQGVIGSGYRRKKIHPATKTFMALRMAVNAERESVEKFLKASIAVIRSGGRIAVVTFHSGEDILVKRFFREQAIGCVCPTGFPVCRCGQMPKIEILTKRSIAPSEEEIRKNPRSRSARLRAVEKK